MLKYSGFGGILADEMGLGKTVQTAAFLACLKFTNQGVRHGMKEDAKVDKRLEMKIMRLCTPRHCSHRSPLFGGCASDTVGAMATRVRDLGQNPRQTLRFVSLSLP